MSAYIQNGFSMNIDRQLKSHLAKIIKKKFYKSTGYGVGKTWIEYEMELSRIQRRVHHLLWNIWYRCQGLGNDPFSTDRVMYGVFFNGSRSLLVSIQENMTIQRYIQELQLPFCKCRKINLLNRSMSDLLSHV